MSSNRLAERLTELISRGELLRDNCKSFTTGALYGSGAMDLDDREKFDQWKLSCLNLIELLAGQKSIFYKHFPTQLIDVEREWFQECMAHYLSVLRALDEELKCGYLQGVETLVAKDMLSTMTDEAKMLLKAKYKDAAAIYCRVILESSIKKYSDKNSVFYTKNDKLSIIIDKLKAKDLLTIPEWRQIQAWMDIGNAAAHGNFSDYSELDIQNMLNAIETFIDAKLR